MEIRQRSNNNNNNNNNNNGNGNDNNLTIIIIKTLFTVGKDNSLRWQTSGPQILQLLQEEI